MFSPLFAQAQSPKKYFTHFGQAEGLIPNNIHKTYKSSDGYIWIDSEAGLIRFDGHSFTKATDIFASWTNKIAQFSENGVFQSNKLVYSHLDSFYVCDLIAHHCESFKIPNNLKKSRIYSSSIKDEYFLVKGPTMYILNTTNKTFKKIYSFSENRILYVLSFDDKNLIVVHDTIVHITDQNGLIKNEIKYPNISNPGFLTAAKVDSNSIIFGTWVEGMLLHNLKTKISEPILWGDRYKEHHGIFSVFVDPQKVIWLCTVFGLKTYDLASKKFEHLSSDTKNNRTIFKNANSTMMDDQGIYWISTKKGLSVFSPNYKSIKEIPIKFSNLKAKTNIISIAFEPHQQKDSLLFINYYYDKTIKYDLINSKQVPFKGKLKYFFTENSIFYDLKYFLNYLYVVREDYKVFKIDEKYDKIDEVPMTDQNDRIIWFKSLDELFGISLGGVYVLDPHSGCFKRNEELRNHFLQKGLDPFIIDMCSYKNIFYYLTFNSDSNQNVLVAHDTITNNFKDFPIKIKDEIKNYHLKGISVNKKGEMLLSSNYGLLFGNIQQQSITFRLVDHFFGRYISSCGEMASSNNLDYWIKHEQGVYKVKSVEKRSIDFNTNNCTIEGHHNSFLHISPNTQNIYIVNENSLDLIEDNQDNISKPYFIQLTEVKIDDKRVPFNKNQDEIILNSSNYKVELQFSNFDYTNTQEQLFDYSFSSVGSGWTAMKGNTLVLDNLKSGSFDLKIRVLNFDGNFVPKAYLMKIKVMPPFRQTWWFITLVVCLTGFIIWSIFKMRENEIKRLQKLRINIARNLHDDMGSQLSQIKMLSEYNNKIKGIKDFDIITDKLGEVMQNMSEIVWSINPKYDSFSLIISKLIEYGVDIFEKKGINFHIDVEETEIKLKMDLEGRRHVFLIFKEAMNNSLKYSNAGNITFSVNKQGKNIHIQLTDNGIGFDSNLIKKGNGLLNMQERAKAIRCNLLIQSSSEGTKVELIIGA